MAGLEVGVVPSDVDDRCVDVGELSLRYLRKGDGPALVYLHDSLGNIGWLPLFEDLAATFDVVVPDLPGFGASQCPTWARSTRDVAILIAQLIARLESQTRHAFAQPIQEMKLPLNRCLERFDLRVCKLR